MGGLNSTVVLGGAGEVLELVRGFLQGNEHRLFKVVEGSITFADVLDLLIGSGYKLRDIRRFNTGDEHGFDMVFDIGEGKVCDITVYVGSGGSVYRVAVVCMSLR